MNTGDFCIRPYRLSDLSSLSDLQAKMIKHHSPFDVSYYALSPEAPAEFQNYLKERVDDPDFALFLAENLSKAPAGYVMGRIEIRPPIYLRRKMGYLSNIFVDEKFRRVGLGSRLAAKLLEWFHQKKVDFIEVTVNHLNQEAREEFLKLGFKPHLNRLLIHNERPV